VPTAVLLTFPNSRRTAEAALRAPWHRLGPSSSYGNFVRFAKLRPFKVDSSVNIDSIVKFLDDLPGSKSRLGQSAAASMGGLTEFRLASRHA
jgi:hypothetical protein